MPGLDLPITASTPNDAAIAGDGAPILRALATALQAQVSPWVQGAFAARPSPAVPGMRYLATDVPAVYEATGSVWMQLATQAQITAETNARVAADNALTAKLGIRGHVVSDAAGRTSAAQGAGFYATDVLNYGEIFVIFSPAFAASPLVLVTGVGDRAYVANVTASGFECWGVSSFYFEAKPF